MLNIKSLEFLDNKSFFITLALSVCVVRGKGWIIMGYGNGAVALAIVGAMQEYINTRNMFHAILLGCHAAIIKHTRTSNQTTPFEQNTF